jgi:ATP-binding cassette, subfamily A (ABC1), member 3
VFSFVCLRQDEADILGDRIAIMAEGKLQCVGSAMFLKSAYGVGYTLTIVKNQLLASDAHDEETKKHSSAGHRVDRTALITDTVRKHVAVAEPLSNVGAEQSFRLPFAASANLADMFEDMDANRDHLGVVEYGISVTTLEEVFMRVGKSSHSHPAEFSERNSIGPEDVLKSSSKSNSQTKVGKCSSIALFGYSSIV